MTDEDGPFAHTWAPDMHFGRSWPGGSHHLEDDCPCEQAPCGLVVANNIHPDCEQHNLYRAKTIRQAHNPDQCPGKQ